MPELIERARERAAADGLDAGFRVEDAQSLSFRGASFDVELSVYGVQFAPDQEKAAAEMLRECRTGGRIGLATPVREGWSGDLFAIMAKYVPPPSGLNPPLRWGTEAGLDELLGGGSRSIESEKRTALQYYRSVDHAAAVFLTFFGPAVRASEGGSGEPVRGDLRNLFRRYNRATDGTAVIETP